MQRVTATDSSVFYRNVRHTCLRLCISLINLAPCILAWMDQFNLAGNNSDICIYVNS